MAHAAAAQQSFWRAPTLADAARALPGDSALRFVAEQGLKASEAQAGTLVANVDRPTWIATSVQRAVDAVQLRLQNGLALLATVGSTAPFVGLFGTVWGIYHALVAIGVSGQASIDKVAGPVGEALIMTAIGLAVAVPAVIGYNGLVRRNKVAMEKVRAFGTDLQQVLLAARP
jgi:biopolymer transport protein ExbB